MPVKHWRFPETKASYYAMIELLDEQFGRLLEYVDSRGESENTIVVYTSDHGEMLGDHGLVLKGCRFYEPLVRVPLIISWPGHFAEGLRSDALVELSDLAPTLLETADQPVPPDLHGRSLVPILTGASSPSEHRDFVRSEYLDAVNLPDETRATMYRDRKWKIVVYHNHGIGELYDLRNDPGEFENLWDDADLAGTKADLLQRSLNASMMALDTSPDRVMHH